MRGEVIAVGKKHICIGGFLMLIAFGVTAQNVYVTDELRLGLHLAEDTSDSAFKTLVSGERLDLLERNRYYARVRTEEGEEGWVKASYLVDDKPAKLRAKEMETTMLEATEKLSVVEQELEAAQAKVGQLETRISSTRHTADENVRDVEKFQEENESFQRQLEIYRSSVPLTWALGAGAVFMTLGFLGGLWWLDARIRRRHGGFRIY